MSRKNIDLSLLQIECGRDRESSFEKLNLKIQEMEEIPDILILPEYFGGLKNGGPRKKLVEKNAVTLESKYVGKLREKAREIEAAIVAPLYRKESEKNFNSIIFIDEKGKIKGFYDKIHLFDALGHIESKIFEKGEKPTVIEWKGVKIGLSICFDLRFPELFRILRKMGSEVVIVPSSWYSGSHKLKQWKSLILARAHENNYFVVGVDQPKPHFVGNSMVASPLGYEITCLGEKEEIRIVEIDTEEVEKSKKDLPLEKLARDEIYKKYNPYKNYSE